jgi:two-component system LytT family response regulator
MNAIEKSLDPETFLRVHRSIVVNVRRIKELESVQHGEYMITLQNGIRLKSGRTYHEKLQALAANPF